MTEPPFTTAHPNRDNIVNLPMLLIYGYFTVEYLRPPFLEVIRPALVIQILFLIWFALRLNKIRTLLQDTYFKLFIALMALMSVHLFVATNNYWAFQQWKVMLTYFFFAIALCMAADTPRRFKAAISVFVIFNAICAVNRLLGLPYFGVSGPMGDTNDFALAMNVVIPISFFVGLHHSGVKRLMYWLFCILFITGNVISISRGGFVGLAAVAIAIFFLSRHKIRALIILMAFSVIFWALVPESFKNEIQSIYSEGAEAGTGEERIELWKIAWRGYLDNPVIGLGQGNMPLRMPDYQYDNAGNSFFPRAVWFRSVHSIYFTVLPELGTVGFLLWIWFLKSLYHKFRFVKTLDPSSTDDEVNPVEAEHLDYIRQIGYGLMIAVLGYLVTGAFLSAFYYPSLWNLSAMITAGYLVKKKIHEQTEEVVA